MTADQFNMRHLTFMGRGEWRINIRDCDLAIQADVLDDDVQECIKEQFPYVSDTLKHELLERVDNDWDMGRITDEEKDVFLRILEKVMP